MSDNQRQCLDCSVDITMEHWNRRRCKPCAEVRNKSSDRQRARLRHLAIGPRLWPAVCKACNGDFLTPRRAQQYCSHKCSKSVRIDATCPVCSETFETYAARPARFCSVACKSWAERNGDGPAMTARSCGWCAQSIIGRNRRAIYCSDRCMRTAAQSRRAAKGAGNLARDRVLALHVFERDNWACHLCRGTIDPKVRKGPEMPSLDHLIPVSHPEYPGHVIHNLAAAHLRCNSLRSDTVTEQVRMLYVSLGRKYGAGELAAPAVGKARLVTHCPKQHPYDPPESYPGSRYCRECNRIRGRKLRGR